MKKAFLHTVLLLIVAGFFSGCSTEKNTRASRTYHNLTSKYNIHFNGRESLKAGIERINKSVDDDYTHVLPIYKESYPAAGNTSRADMDNAVMKGNKTIQIHSITKKPKRQRLRTRAYQQFASKEEFNNWIDDSYLLMGQGYFYMHNFSSAAENFSLILRKFPEEKIRYDAMVWLIRSYSELERFPEALEIIQLLQSDKSFPRKLEKELAKATADLYMKQMDYPESIKYLDICMKKCSDRKEKARLQYILAQLYRETGNEEKAREAFMTVRKFNPPYKMAFNAWINAAGIFSGQGDPEKLKKELHKMLRDEKNLEFRDQIYFALANILFREGSREEAIGNYRKSVSSSIDNNYQLALSSITLADIYFEEPDYLEARAYYDSAMMVVGEEYPDYDKLNQRYRSLSRLVENLTTVEVQDSLQKLALMPEKDRDALIDKWIALEQEKKREEELIASQQQSERGYYRANEYRFGLGQSDEGGGWYFYNPQTVSYGKAQFQQRWGRRKLEDDWRRLNKSTVPLDEMDELAQFADSASRVARVEDPLDRSFYTQDLPLTDSLMALSHDKIRDALYNAGRIFKSDFSDYPRSAGSYEELNQRYPDNLYLLSVWFELYDLYELIGDAAKAAEYRNLIIGRFPESKYAQYLLNPNFFDDLQARTDSLNRLYQDVFRDYKSGRYRNVIPVTQTLKKLDPDSLLLAKIDFIGTVSEGTQSDMQQFGNGLRNYIQTYPHAEPVLLAREILTLIEDSTLTDYQKLVDMGYLHDEIRNDEMQPGNQPENDEFGGKFSYEEDLLHYFVIAYPRNSGIDVNRLKFDIANYNLDHYTKFDFDIEEENLDGATNLLLVRSLTNKEQGLIYFRAIIRQSEVFRTLRNVDYYNFVASSTNYRQVLNEKSVTDYLKFYLRNYSRFIGPDFNEEGVPETNPEELMARAQQEDELLKERGKFVTVDVPGSQEFFSTAIDTSQSFVVAVRDKSFSLRTMLTQFADFNRDNFRVMNLALQIKQAGDYQFMVVQGLPGYAEGLSYFRRVILERSLFRSLGQITYRNFLITGYNLERVLEKGDVDRYMEFFRNSYLQRTGETRPAAPVQTTPATSVKADAPTVTPEPVSSPDYNGPYSLSVKKAHLYILIIPSEGINKNELIEGIREFNKVSYPETALLTEEQPLDNFRTIIRISGLTDDTTAVAYLRGIVNNRPLFAPLGNSSYRNLIITPENFTIFLERKNITEYMDFYRVAYPNG